MNGDWIDGTGLAMNGDAQHLIPILEKMNFDAVTVGNHELYMNSVIAEMMQPAGFIEFLGHRYVSSNVVRTERPDRSIGNKYTLLRGRHANLLVFGFLYEMKDTGDLVTVAAVNATVQEPWFQAAVKATNDYHAILVLAHMDVNDPLLQIILSAIRVRDAT
jgi:2',3'-cyclic-nucleotide 2'-phosphodiesterase (5'-nucleotidase family)